MFRFLVALVRMVSQLVGCRNSNSALQNQYKSNADKKTESAIHNAIRPARISEILCCPMLGRAIVLVPEDQLALALGEGRGNERQAREDSGWEVEIMTLETLDKRILYAVNEFKTVSGIDGGLAERLVGEGFLSFSDLSLMHPDDLCEMSGLNALQAKRILSEAENRALDEDSNPNR